MVTVSKPRAKRERKVGKLDLSRAPGSDVAKQSIERRLVALNRSIDDDIKALKSAVFNKRRERVIVLCKLIAQKQADGEGLADRLVHGLSADHLPDPQAKPPRSRLRVRHDPVKRYKMFSDK